MRVAVADRPGESVVDHGSLGAAALLAELPVDRLRREPDVAVLLALDSTESGRHAVAALETFCRTGSLRSAAAALHLRHSSVAARLATVEAALGYRLDDPAGRFRARLAVLGRALAAS